MNTIKITGNNGSVPDNYFKQFELTFQSDGTSNFTLINGREESAIEVINESKQLQSKDIEKIMFKAEHLTISKSDKPNVGGPQKTILLQYNNKESVLEILPTEIEALHFINQCLLLYDSGLLTRLVDVI